MGTSELRFSADANDALRKMQQMADQQEKFIRRQVAANDRLRAAAKEQRQEAVQAHEDAYGSGAQAKITQFVTRLASIGVVVQGARLAMAEFAREGREAVAQATKLAGGITPAAGQARSFAELEQASQTQIALRLRSGMSGEAAGALSTTLLGYGRLGDAMTYAQLQGVSDPTQAAHGVESMRTAGAGGGTADILGRLVLAGRTARSADYGVLGLAQAQLMSRAKGTGFGEEQMLAALAVSSRATRSPMAASEGLGELAQAMAKRRIGGGDLFGGVEELRGRGYSAERLERLLGGSGAQAYQRLEGNLDLARSTEREIRGTPGADVLEDMDAMVKTGSLTGLQRRKDITRARAEIAELRTQSGALQNELMADQTREETADLNVFSRMSIRALEWMQPRANADQHLADTITGAMKMLTGGSIGPREQPGDIRVGQ